MPRIAASIQPDRTTLVVAKINGSVVATKRTKRTTPYIVIVVVGREVPGTGSYTEDLRVTYGGASLEAAQANAAAHRGKVYALRGDQYWRL